MTRRWILGLLLWAAACDGGEGGVQSGDLIALDTFDGTVEQLHTALGPGDTVTLAVICWGRLNVDGQAVGESSARWIVLLRLDADRSLVWSQALRLDYWHQIELSLAVAPNGDVLLAVDQLRDAIDLGGGELLGSSVWEHYPNAGALARYGGTAGDHLWSRVLEQERPFGIENVAVQDVTATEDDGILITALAFQGGLRAYVARLDPSDGSVVWEQPVGPNGGRNQTGSRLIVAADDTVVVTVTDYPNSDRSSAAVSRLDADDGDLRWEVATPHLVLGDVEVAVDGAGQVAIAHQLALIGEELADTVIVDKLDGDDGEHLWSWVIGTGTWDDLVNDPFVAIDSAGNVVVTGIFRGSVLIGDRVLSSDADALFALKLDADGNTRWSRYANTITEAVQPVTAAEVWTDREDHVIASGTLRAVHPGDQIFLLELAP